MSSRLTSCVGYRPLCLPPVGTSTSTERSLQKAYSSVYASSYPAENVIVISGISGRFPKSANMAEFQANLLQGSDMTTPVEKRWRNAPAPRRFGFLDCLSRFDASFFKLTAHQANQLDPQARLLMEVTLEAILDAGHSPSDLEGPRTGVFCAALGGEAMGYSYLRYDRELARYAVFSQQHFIIPARIAFAFNFQGPSTHLSSACSSSLTAIEAAVNQIRVGNIDAAIVTGSNVLLNPRDSLEFMAFGALAPDGVCRTFDKSGAGLVRAEAAIAILIERESTARRRYARILNIRSNTDGFKPTGLTHPSGERQEELFRETWEQSGMDPAEELFYLEAHGTGTPTGDPEELRAVSRAFCSSRPPETALLIGSVKSNMGHSESAAGLAGIAKAIVAIQTGTIPGNLHFETPGAELESLMNEGKMKVVTENAAFHGGPIGINSFGLGGTNSHLILQPGEMMKQQVTFDGPCVRQLPTLVPLAGRTESGVRQSLEQAISHADNPDYVYLLQSAFAKAIPGFKFRGYGLVGRTTTCGKEIGKTSSVAHKVHVQSCETVPRRQQQPPLWIIFPGLGTQWSGMGQELMCVEPFTESIRRSAETMTKIGMDLDWLLPPRNHNNSVANTDERRLAHVSRSVIQIALWDTLRQVLPSQLSPDGIIGHSDGELLCAYADGCFTAEETLLMSDARARACADGLKTTGFSGAMASIIGMSAEEVRSQLPSQVQIACINSPRNVTISGEGNEVRQFAQRLQEERKVAVMMLNCFELACHSSFVDEISELFVQYAQGILPDDHNNSNNDYGRRKAERFRRSSRWKSTCFSDGNPNSGTIDESSTWASFASVEYFRQNMRLPVLFYDALRTIEPGSVLIELSPMESIKSLLKDSIPAQDYVHITPMRFKAEDRLDHFYESVGQMYAAGLDVDMRSLYPEVATTPVAASTPFISPLIKWDHSESWKTHILNFPLEAGYETIVDLKSPTHAHIEGHKVDDSIVYPATGYIVLIWRDFVEALGLDFQSTPVLLRNVKFQRAQVLGLGQQPLKILTVFLTGCGKFELKIGPDVLVCGEISLMDRREKRASSEEGEKIEKISAAESAPPSTYCPLTGQDLYKELSLRGLNYSGDFRSLLRADVEGKWTESSWRGNWIAFLDTLLQSLCLSSFERSLRLPVGIQRIEIDPEMFLGHVAELKRDAITGGTTVRVTVDATERIVSCPGVVIKSVETAVAPRKHLPPRGNLGFERHTFCPHIQHEQAGSDSQLDFRTSMWEMMDLVVENSSKRRLTVLDVFSHRDNSMAQLFLDFIKLQPRHDAQLFLLTWSSEAVKLEESHKNMGTVIGKSNGMEPLISDASTASADLIIIEDTSVDELNAFASRVTDSTFILLVCSSGGGGGGRANEYVPTTTAPADFVSLCEKSHPDGTKITLFRKRKKSPKVSHFAIHQSHCDDFEWVPRLQQFLSSVMISELSPAHRIYLTSQSDQTSGILGFTKCLVEELGQKHLRCIFDPESSIEFNFTNPSHMLKSIMEKDLVFNVVKKKGGHLGSYRLLPLSGSLGEKFEGENGKGNVPEPATCPRTSFSSDKVYIVVGGLGGFGLEVANWMIERGAKHLVLTSRSGVVSGYQRWCLRKWGAVFGASVQTPVLDLANSQEAEAFFQSLCLPIIGHGGGGGSQVGGIFNCAMELQNDDFYMQSKDTFGCVVAPKALLTQNLDVLSRKYCPNMEYFVAFSSQVGVMGCANQTNYGWANSALDRICEKRFAQGLHALSIQWGLVGQVGYAFDKLLAPHGGENTDPLLDGFAPQNIQSCLDILDKALGQKGVPLVSSMVVAPKQLGLHGPEKQEGGGIFLSRLKGILGFSNDVSFMDSSRKLSELGLDSLMTFELQRICLTEFQLVVRRETLSNMTIADLQAIEKGEYSLT